MRLFSGWRGRRESDPEDGVQISEKDGVRYLHLGSATVQSAMRLADPSELVLSYTRSMMACLLFAPQPARATLIGLGGGSLAKWLLRHLPATCVVAVELNPRVIVCARQYFALPPDDRRLQVVQAEGAQWIANQPDSADLILVDGYDGRSQVEELCAPEFYSSAARALSPDGMLVVNLWGNDRRFDQYAQRIEGAFDGQVVCVPAIQKGNIAVLAFKRRPLVTRWDELRDRARELEGRYGLEFLRFVELMKDKNPHTEKRLLV